MNWYEMVNIQVEKTHEIIELELLAVVWGLEHF